MIKVLALSVFLISNSVLGKIKGLPWVADTTTLLIKPIARSQYIDIDFRLSVPKNNKLGAGSFISVYEKVNRSEWSETKRFELEDLLSLQSEILFTKKVELKSDVSDLAIHSTIYHCGKTGCYIQAFQGVTKRSMTGGTLVPFHITGNTL
jgi:hypothetical protein